MDPGSLQGACSSSGTPTVGGTWGEGEGRQAGTLEQSTEARAHGRAGSGRESGQRWGTGELRWRLRSGLRQDGAGLRGPAQSWGGEHRLPGGTPASSCGASTLTRLPLNGLPQRGYSAAPTRRLGPSSLPGDPPGSRFPTPVSGVIQTPTRCRAVGP